MTTISQAPATARIRRRLWRRNAAVRTGGLRQAGPLTYFTLVAVLFFFAFPLYWSLVVASRSNEAVATIPPPLTLGANLFTNIARVFDTVNFAKAMMNSVIVAGTITLSVLFFSTLAGFAFAKLRFRGRNALFLAVIGTMMVPQQLGIIPLYMLMAEYGWTAKMQAVIVPMLVTAFGVFWMRQFIAQAVPTELLEAGRVDGARTMGLYWHVVLPAVRPAMAVLGMLTFMQAWNDFFWPLIVLSPEDPTVQVAIATLAAGYYQDYSLVLTGALLSILPVLAVFAVFAKQVIHGIMEGAVKT
jgi:cellobiose transport system permease protein